jgi:hypothetical protein
MIGNDSEILELKKQSIIQKLKEKGLNITPQRCAIIDVLVENKHLHPGASFVYKEDQRTDSLCHDTQPNGTVKVLPSVIN